VYFLLGLVLLLIAISGGYSQFVREGLNNMSKAGYNTRYTRRFLNGISNGNYNDPWVNGWTGSVVSLPLRKDQTTGSSLILKVLLNLIHTTIATRPCKETKINQSVMKESTH
jgi:hypothetical protein